VIFRTVSCTVRVLFITRTVRSTLETGARTSGTAPASTLNRVAISMSASGRRANPTVAERWHLLIERLLWVSIKRVNATAKAYCMQQTDQYKGQGYG